MKISSISSYVLDGILDPEPVMYGFGNEKPNIVSVRYAIEYSKDGIDVFNEEHGPVGTQFVISSEYCDINKSYITGQDLYGWSMDYEDAEVGIADFEIGDTFTPSTRGVYTFFPVFYPYVRVATDADPGCVSSKEISVSMAGETATIDNTPNLSCDFDGMFDKDQIVVVPVLTTELAVDVVDPQYTQDAEGGDDPILRMIIDGREHEFSVAAGHYTVQYPQYERNKISSAGCNHYVEYLYGSVPVVVSFTDKVKEWKVYPKMVYSTVQPDDQPPVGNQG